MVLIDLLFAFTLHAQAREVVLAYSRGQLSAITDSEGHLANFRLCDEKGACTWLEPSIDKRLRANLNCELAQSKQVTGRELTTLVGISAALAAIGTGGLELVRRSFNWGERVRIITAQMAFFSTLVGAKHAFSHYHHYQFATGLLKALDGGPALHLSTREWIALTLALEQDPICRF